ncbi:MAG: ADP-glyceromanno-heptose 6-epimerase [Deltaproteobacteria bacterium]|jgi:ADP-L-glycero-D-manno-heptose 6-epimerase|nr:ADP-glyceromanno-heptose 6-epimerase [Deltaproteobacteria bacterium]
MYIITGGAGFIGSALLWELNSHGIDNILIVDNLSSSDKWKNLVKSRFLAYLPKDEFLRHIEEDNLLEALSAEHLSPSESKIQGIVHLGACSSTTESNADYLMQNNLEYSKTLCAYAVRRGIRYIQASSAATYGDGEQGFDDDQMLLSRLKPLNMYAFSKHLFDLWAIRTGCINNIAGVKFFNVYGPNEYHKGDMRSMVQKAVEQVQSSGRVRLFKSYKPEYLAGGQLRDFVYVKDCVKILYILLQHTEINGIFNLGTGKARNWNDLATAVFTAMNLKPNLEYIEMPDSLRGKYQYFTEAKMQRLEAALGEPFKFTGLEEGVIDYVQNYLLQEDKYL